MARLNDSRETPLILIVDDEDDILDLVKYNIEKEGFDTLTARDGAEAVDIAEKEHPDLIILDIMMPRMDGIEASRRLREHARLRSTPILMLTAKSEEEDHVVGLEQGADIYLTKPISIPILTSQVKALLRGSSRYETPPDVLRILDLEIDRDRYVVRRANDEGVRLARKEFDLLFFFASRPGKVFSRQELLDQVWGRDVYVVDRTIDVHVRKIREKIGQDYIETIKGVGYRFRDDPHV
ncbi:MAG: response regulator transcription factor [Rhodothermales bacterium]|nr:response regulator transcription factor [Rhodothermales bacterium]